MPATTRFQTGSHPSQKSQLFHDRRLTKRVIEYRAMRIQCIAERDAIKKKEAKKAGKKAPRKTETEEKVMGILKEKVVNITARQWVCCCDGIHNQTSVVWCRNCRHYTVNCLDVSASEVSMSYLEDADLSTIQCFTY